MQYSIELKKGEFKLSNSESKEILTLGKYNYASKIRCTIRINDLKYLIRVSSAWENKFEIRESGKVVGEIEIGWNGEYIVSLVNAEKMSKYFKMTIDYGWKNTKVHLKDFLTNHLCTINMGYDWKTYKPNINLVLEEGYHQEDNMVDKILLLSIVIYCSGLMMAYGLE